MKLYPLKFTPIYKEKIWGGRRLEDVYGRRLPAGVRIGESWDVSDHGDDVSRVESGAWAGRSLRELIAEMPVEILGSALVMRCLERFPLLVKLIDASENLSLQVHPPDDYVAVHERGEWGKTELWYVVRADEGAELVCGFRTAVARGAFARALEEGTLLNLLRPLKTHDGDAIFVPAGRVHSIGAGNLIFEIAENSDVTYRLYDWERAGSARPLQIKKAMEVVNFGDGRDPRIAATWEDKKGFRRAHLATCRHFRTVQVEIGDVWGSIRTGERFSIISVVRGSGALEYGDAGEIIELRSGDTLLLPAALGGYRVRAGTNCCNILETEVP
ncbi:MAG: mannose-6-phosphate isomerase [bacterium]